MKNPEENSIVYEYETLYNSLSSKGLEPWFQTLDNKAFNILIKRLIDKKYLLSFGYNKHALVQCSLISNINIKEPFNCMIVQCQSKFPITTLVYNLVSSNHHYEAHAQIHNQYKSI